MPGLEEQEEQEETKEEVKQEPEAEDQEEEEKEEENKYMLLERLLKFIRSKDKPLNAVLSGYFSKVFTLLINRKQKSLLPYIFNADSDVLDSLLFHVYQKSISDILNKLLTLGDANRQIDEEL